MNHDTFGVPYDKRIRPALADCIMIEIPYPQQEIKETIKRELAKGNEFCYKPSRWGMTDFIPWIRMGYDRVIHLPQYVCHVVIRAYPLITPVKVAGRTVSVKTEDIMRVWLYPCDDFEQMEELLRWVDSHSSWMEKEELVIIKHHEP